MTFERLRELDLRHLWHPYTDINRYERGPFICFTRAEGVYLYDQTGRPVLDGISSWWAAALGHGHPRLVEAIREQAGVLQHSILGNLAHPRAIELAAKLAEITPAGLNHVYFAADGASATEAALKIAIQYWHNIGRRGRTRFICLEEGYHGDTLGAVGVGFVPQFHAPFEEAVRRAYTAPTPFIPCSDGDPRIEEHAARAFEGMKALVERHHEEIAGIILEPLCQGAAGIRIYPEDYLRRVRALCDEYDLLLIADEIAVGFGRTGAMFACERAGILPDILCLGKALTGGYLPASAAVVTGRIYDSFRGDADHDRTFYDGHTFCGNPITSACALAAIEVYASEDVIAKAVPRAEQLRRGMAEIARHPSVAYYRALGLIGMCAFTQESGGAARARAVAQKALELGLFIRPLGPVLYLWPPLVVTEGELAEMLRVFAEAIDNSPHRKI